MNDAKKTKELFKAIRDNYYLAATNIWGWYKERWLLRLITLPFILIGILLMFIIGTVFSLGIFLDQVSTFLEKRRKLFISFIEDKATNIRYSKISFLFSPLIIVLSFPICLILGLFPKWSVTLIVVLDDYDIDDISQTSTEHGFFARCSKAYLNFLGILWSYTVKHGFLFFFPALGIAIIFSPFIIAISIVCVVLILLDFLGFLFGLIRKFVVNSSGKMARAADKGFPQVFIMPILLTLFVPLYLFLLLIPKIASEYDSSV